MTSLLQKINELDIRVDGLDSSNLQTQITTNSNDISTLQTDKMDILIAGDNITIVGNTISSSGGGSVTQADLDLKQNVIDSSSIINCNSLNTTGNVVVGDILTQYGASWALIASDTQQTTNTNVKYTTSTVRNCTYTSSNGTITIIKSGRYHISYSFMVQGTGAHELRLKKNGVNVPGSRAYLAAMAGNYKTLGTSIILDLVADDKILVFINTGLVWIDDSGNFNGYLIGN
jgi:hypothetical protein